MLKSYITIGHANQVNCSDVSVNNTSTSSSESQIRVEMEEAINLVNKKYDSFVKQLASILEMTAGESVEEEKLIESINKLK